MPSKQSNQSRRACCLRGVDAMVSRRKMVSCSGFVVAAMLSRPALGQESRVPSREGRERREPPPEVRERMEQSRAFGERMQNASGPEEMRKIMEEQANQHRTRAVEDLKGQLGVSDQEWAVVRPRVEAVYDLVHPRYQSVRGPGLPSSPVDQRIRALREVLADKEAASEKIKVALTALRAAKEQTRQELVKARQDLRQIMTLRQEAVLVLNGLLD